MRFQDHNIFLQESVPGQSTAKTPGATTRVVKQSLEEKIGLKSLC